MTRWSASAIHLAISLIIGGGFALLTLLFWYPGPLFQVSGAVGLLMILVPVDIVLGPLLTLLVFKPGKPSLRFDLTVIALLQCSALLYGAWTIAEVRPSYIVLFGKQLTVVRSLDLAENRPWQTPLGGPQWVVVPVRDGADAEFSEFMAGLMGKQSPVLDIGRYQPLHQQQSLLVSALLTIEEVPSKVVSQALTEELARQALAPDSVTVLPIRVRDQQMTAVFAGRSTRLLAILPVPLEPTSRKEAAGA